MASASEQLDGKTLPSGWIVTSKLPTYPGVTGGNFSTGYFVEKDGVRAFMKAMDYSRAARAANLTAELHKLTTEILFERNVLEICEKGKFTKIVRLIDGGTYSFPGLEHDIMWRVEYFIFELADSDLRKMLTFNGLGDAAWNLRIMHQAAVGLTQLHEKGIAHQDLKPSNILTVKSAKKNSPENFKIGDLGKSSIQGVPGPNDHWIFPGDPHYITPEALYGFREPEWVDRREAADGFMLGNLLAFLFVGTPMTALIFQNLDPQFYPASWKGDFAGALPYVIDAHTYALASVSPKFPMDAQSELTEILRTLTHPDPKKRGDTTARASAGRRFGLNRYVSRFDRLAKSAEFHLNAKGIV
jgi:serine/threonine protein kinase